MSVQIHSLTPESSNLEINIRLSAKVNITAFSARQKVTGYLVDEISTNLHGGEPQLVVGEHIRWRVPVILSMPPSGDREEVGLIDVDIVTGQLLVNRTIIEEIKGRAQHLASRSTSSAA